MLRVQILMAVATLALAPQLIDAACKVKSPCSCEKDNGTVINIGGLGKLTVNDAVNKNDYIFEPCKTFNIGALKATTFVQHAQVPNVYVEIANDKGVTFDEETGGNAVQMVMTSKLDPNLPRIAKILLTCVPSGKTTFAFSSEYPTLTYNFVLSSPSCCPRSPSSGGSSSLSVGSILVILFFVVLVLYIVIGVVFQMKVRQSEGRERIPNVSFWTALPGLIRDGFRFTISCGSQQTTYNRI